MSLGWNLKDGDWTRVRQLFQRFAQIFAPRVDTLETIIEETDGYFEYIYIRSYLTPTAPATYDWSLTDWTAEIPEGDAPLWYCTALKNNDGTFSEGVTEWTGPVRLEASSISFTIPQMSGFEWEVDGEGVPKWSAGTITFDGTEYSIAAWDTGDSTADSKGIYWLNTAGNREKFSAVETPTIVANRWYMAYFDGTSITPAVQSNILHGGLIQAHSIDAEQVVTDFVSSMSYTVDSGGNIHGGQTAYDNGVGFWLENRDGATPRLSIGDSTGNKFLFDGTDIDITGSVTITNPEDINTSDLTNDAGWTDDTAAIAAQAAAEDAQNTADARVSTFYQAGTPTAEAEGDIWFDTDDYTIKRWNGSNWTSEEVSLTADSIRAGTISASIAIASPLTMSANFVMDSSGALYTTGKTSYTSDVNGIFLGYDIDKYKMYIGNADKHLKWDGTDIIINGVKGKLGADANNYYDITGKEFKTGSATDFVTITSTGLLVKGGTGVSTQQFIRIGSGNLFYIKSYSSTGLEAASRIFFIKSHSNTETAIETLDGEFLGGLDFKGHDENNNPRYAVSILAKQAGSSGSNFVPGKLKITTTTVAGAEHTWTFGEDGAFYCPGAIYGASIAASQLTGTIDPSRLPTDTCGIATGSYTGTGANQNISLGSGNAAIHVIIKRDGTADANAIALYDGSGMRCWNTNVNDNATDNDPISQHADGFTLIGADTTVNKSGDTYYYTAFYKLN